MRLLSRVLANTAHTSCTWPPTNPVRVWRRSAAVLALLTAVSCGSDDGDEDNTDTTPTGSEPTTSGAPSGPGPSNTVPGPNSMPTGAATPPGSNSQVPTPPPAQPEGSGGQPSTPSPPPTNMPTASGGMPNVGGTPGVVGGADGIAGMNVGGDPGTGGTMNPPEDIVPTVAGNEYTLALPSATLVADGPSGRITALNVDGANRLTTSAVNPLNYGSSFWTAPQSVWSWPPPFDALSDSTIRSDYAHSIEGNAILLEAPPTTQGSEEVSISKRFSADAARDLLILDYTITNAGSAAISTAPWEITRMVPEGLTFYPTGTTVTQDEIPTTEADGVTWLDYSAGGITDGTKNIADGAEGWMAHVDDGLLFLKVFPEITADMAAPGEGEIEIYVESTYVELEQQGAYEELAPGASSSWQVLWLVRPVPAEVPVSAQSAELVAWVRGIVAEL